MAKYKKTFMPEAWRWTSGHVESEPAWVQDAFLKWPNEGGILFEPEHPDGPRLKVATPEGVMTTKVGDWIIQGPFGEVYSCASHVFAATYEEV